MLNQYTTTKTLVIGLCGRAESGKTTIAGWLRDSFATRFHEPCYLLEFGNAVKTKVAELTGGSVETIEANKSDPLMRFILEYVGDKLGTEFFVIAVVQQVEALSKTTPCVVIIPGVRKIEEADLIQGTYGGILIRIRREGYPINPDNISENQLEMLNPNIIFQNPGDNLFHLRKQVSDLFFQIINHDKISTYCKDLSTLKAE